MPANASVTLMVIADHLDRYHEQVGDLVPGFQRVDRDDIAAAMVEAERALRTATRLVRRAAKLAANGPVR